MEPVSTFIQRSGTPTRKCSSAVRIQAFTAEPWLIEFWSRMTIRYGQLWSARWKDSRMLALGQAEWQAELSRFTPEQVTQSLRQFQGEYPPSLNALVSACRSRPLHRRYRALPVPRADQDVALRHLQGIRRILHQGTCA